MARELKKLCLCGCGEFLPIHWYKNGPQVFKFIKEHARRGVGGFDPSVHNPRICACGCGERTNKVGSRYRYFIKGHENNGRTPWNKGKTFSSESRYKMSLARLGKEPTNKAKIDLERLHQLYVKERKNTHQVAEELGISYDAVKNRLRFLKWSRSTKESCTGSAFREQMRLIRIKTLISKPMIESPNKLEKTIYDTLDRFGIFYKKQVSLFNKFVVDVLFPQNNLVLEIFGRYWHEMPINKKKDLSKKRYLIKCGYKVEEIWDYEIKQKGAGPILQEVFKKYNII